MQILTHPLERYLYEFLNLIDLSEIQSKKK